MEPSTKSQKTGGGRLKLAVIPLLVGVLGYVVWSNQSPSTPADAAPAATDAAAPSPTPSAAPSIVAASPAKPTKPTRVAWPKFTTEQILATNPFHGSAAMQASLRTEPAPPSDRAGPGGDPLKNFGDAPTSEERWARLAASLPGGAPGVYLESSKGPALKVGSRTFHVGDAIGEGYRVKQIRPDGIVVEAAPAAE